MAETRFLRFKLDIIQRILEELVVSHHSDKKIKLAILMEAYDFGGPAKNLAYIQPYLEADFEVKVFTFLRGQMEHSARWRH